MNHHVHLAVLTWKEGGVFIADCPPVRIASQGDTEQEALDNLKEAIKLYFEDTPGVELPECGEAHAREVKIALAS